MRPKKADLQAYLNNSDGLFDGLPDLTEKEIRGSNRLRLPKSHRLNLKLKLVEQREKELQVYKKKIATELKDTKPSYLGFEKPDPSQ